MQEARAIGRSAPALKYDILTALLVLSAQDAGAEGRLAQRLALIITARFNWARGSFATGTREIARMWGVTERTAKRELAQMRRKGWISVRRGPARGRVTEHAIHLAEVLDATRAHWVAIGPDFVARMAQGTDETAPLKDNIVPFTRTVGQGGPVADGSLWSAASKLIWEVDPGLHGAWFANVVEAGREGATVDLLAPSRFVAQYIETHFAGRLLAALSSCDPGVTDVRVRAGEGG
jgi:DNA-binding MarR family transcriptional regulator